MRTLAKSAASLLSILAGLAALLLLVGATGLPLPAFADTPVRDALQTYTGALDGLQQRLHADPRPLFAVPLLLLHLLYRALRRPAERRAARPDPAGDRASARERIRQRREEEAGTVAATADTAPPPSRRPLAERYATRSRAPLIVGVGAASLFTLFFALVAFLYFGPGTLRLGRFLQIERGDRATFLARVGLVFGAVVAAHVVIFLLVTAGGYAQKFQKQRTPRSRRKAAFPRRKTAGGEPRRDDEDGPPSPEET